MKRYFDLKLKTGNNFCDIIDPSYMVEIPNDGKAYGLVNNEVVDISETTEYKTKVKKQKKNNAYKAYQEGLIQLKSEDELNQFFKTCGTITQAEYDNRLAITKADLETLKHTYLTEVADD